MTTRSTARLHESRRGVTLFEALLAVALTAVIIGLISAALTFYLRSVDDRRKVVDESILARSILRRFAQDLRSAIDYQPIDVSGLEGAAGAAGLPGEEGLGEEAAAEGEPSDEELMDLIADSLPTSELGLYGNSYEIQVDISRTPRVGEYEIAEITGDYDRLQEILSDIKTVAWYMSDTAGASLAVASVGADQTVLQSPGLIRQTTSRDSAQFALINGGVTSGISEVLASEVVGFELAYFDGIEWLPEWDSMELGALPKAVSVTIALDSFGEGQAATSGSGTPSSIANGNVYRLVVYLPASEIRGEALTEEDMLDEDTTDEETGI